MAEKERFELLKSHTFSNHNQPNASISATFTIIIYQHLTIFNHPLSLPYGEK